MKKNNTKAILIGLIIAFFFNVGGYAQQEPDPRYYPFISGDVDNNTCLSRWYIAGGAAYKRPRGINAVVNAVTEVGLNRGNNNATVLNKYIVDFVSKHSGECLLIYFPAGSYYFDDIIRLESQYNDYRSARIILKGAGAALTTLDINHKGTGIYMHNAYESGVEDLAIIRRRTAGGGGDPSEIGGYNILMRNTTESWVSGVYSKDAFSAHISMQGGSDGMSVSFNTIIGCTFFEALAYGGFEEGYGVNHDGASYNLIENCVFDTLRHAMSYQQDSKYNVAAYNACYRATMEGPADNFITPADISLHGRFNYSSAVRGPMHNLFEGNRTLQCEVDRVHGSNGPYNTFFRTQMVIDLDIDELCFEHCDYPYDANDQFHQNIIGCVDISSATKDEIKGTQLFCDDFWYVNDAPEHMDSRTKSLYHWNTRPEYLTPDMWPYIPPYTYNAAEKRRNQTQGNGLEVYSAYTEGWGKYQCAAEREVHDIDHIFGPMEYPSGDYNGYFSVSSSSFSKCTIKAGKSVSFKARDYITLLPGFTAELGSTFEASLDEDPCGVTGFVQRAAVSSDPVLILPQALEAPSFDSLSGAAGRQSNPMSNMTTIINSYSPNPFTDQLELKFNLKQSTVVTVEIYNELSQKVYQNAQLTSEGENQLVLDLNSLPLGIYTLNFIADSYRKTMRVAKL